MRLTVEIESVICDGNLSDKTYYAFRIVGLPSKIAGVSPVFACSNATYPGNDAMREFFNSLQIQVDKR